MTEERYAKSVIAKYMARHGYEGSKIYAGISKTFGCGESKARKCLADPSCITIGELRKMKGLRDDELLEMIKGKDSDFIKFMARRWAEDAARSAV